MNRPYSSGHPFRCLIALLIGAALVAVSPLMGNPRASAAVPAGFTDSAVTSVSQPTDIAFTPAGTMLITSQGGALYKYSGGTRTTLLNISGKICSNFERGLLGVTVDPLFNSNGYIYLFYTFNKYGGCEYNQPTSPVNRVSRWTVSGSTVSGERVLVDNMPSPGGNHNAGGLLIGKDGYLYISIGDGGCEIGNPSRCGGSNRNARVVNRLQGKILRVSRSSGSAPGSNPFYTGTHACRSTGSTSSGEHCDETFAWGFRNPFRIAADPNAAGTRVFTNDVGQNLWEEVDLVSPGADYGWNICEGFHYTGSSATCTTAYTEPIFEYGHGSCNSITGGAFIPNGNWESKYDGAYFFADYTCGTIWTLKNGARTTFASGLGAVTELEFGPYNSNIALYYANYGSSQIRRISFNSADNDPPTADLLASPTYGPAPLTVAFDARGSSDPDGDTLTYLWNFGDGTSSTSSHPSKTFPNTANYSVSVLVSDGKGGTDTDSVTIRSGSTRPSATILAPTVDHEFAVGETIVLTGKGTDPEDGTLSSSRMTWEVLLRHGSHTHPLFGPTKGNNLSFQAPAPEDLMAAGNSYLQIKLTVRDSSGLGKSVSQNLYPNKVNVEVGSNVPGMLLWVEGTAFTAPVSVASWENNPLTIVAPDQIGTDDQPYLYKSWSDGGRRSHNYITPAVDGAVVATFTPMPGDSFAAHADARVAEAYPNRNEGGGTGLTAKGGTSSDYETVIRFKLAGVGDTVYRARLFLYAYDPTADGPVIYETSPSWKETGVTWNNRPAPIGSSLGNYGPIADNSWIAYDVAAAIDGDGYVAFVIRGTSSDGVSWYSRQAGAHQPRLVVWSSEVAASEEPPPTPTAIPTETAAGPSPTPTAVASVVVTETPPATPVAAPTLPIADQFEGNLSLWVSDGAALAPGAGVGGSQALQVQSAGDSSNAGQPSYVRIDVPPGEPSLFLAMDVRARALDASGTRLATFGAADNSSIGAVYLLPDGSIGIRMGEEDTLNIVGTLDPTVWNHFETWLSTSANGTRVTVWINGAYAGEAPAASGTAAVGTVVLGGWATDRSYVVAIDNVSIDRACLGTCPQPPGNESSGPEPTVSTGTVPATPVADT